MDSHRRVGYHTRQHGLLWGCFVGYTHGADRRRSSCDGFLVDCPRRIGTGQDECAATLQFSTITDALA